MKQIPALALALALAGCTTLRDSGLGYRDHPQTPPRPKPYTYAWPVPKDWTRSKEALAPPFRGTSDVASKPDRFVMVWWIEEGPRLERAVVEAAVKDRVAGLDHVERTGACEDRRFMVVVASSRPRDTWADLNEVAALFQCREDRGRAAVPGP